MSRDEGSTGRTWFGKRRNQVLVAALVLLIAVAAYPYIIPAPPKSSNELALEKAVSYLARNYNFTMGLIPETPGKNVFWVYSDNYLAGLAISRGAGSNQTMATIGLALYFSVRAYMATYSGGSNQYSALNSTLVSFNCPSDHTLTWTGVADGTRASAVVKTTENDGDPSCASPVRNYADILFLEAIYAHRVGNSTGAASVYDLAAKDLDGNGIADKAFSDKASNSSGIYQTYKLALYVYATYCLGFQQDKASDLQTVENAMLSLQGTSGGFASGYQANNLALGPGITIVSGPNTETTALAALALELMVNPNAAC